MIIIYSNSGLTHYKNIFARGRGPGEISEKILFGEIIPFYCSISFGGRTELLFPNAKTVGENIQPVFGTVCDDVIRYTSDTPKHTTGHDQGDSMFKGEEATRDGYDKNESSPCKL